MGWKCAGWRAIRDDCGYTVAKFNFAANLLSERHHLKKGGNSFIPVESVCDIVHQDGAPEFFTQVALVNSR